MAPNEQSEGAGAAAEMPSDDVAIRDQVRVVEEDSDDERLNETTDEVFESLPDLDDGDPLEAGEDDTEPPHDQHAF